MAGWTLHILTPNLKDDTAQVGFINSATHAAISMNGVKYDGSGDLTEKQLKKRILLASKEALDDALAAIQADLDALGE